MAQLKNQHGAVLLMVLVTISLLGLMAGMAGSSWQTIVQRSKEEDLLWKGNQIRRAIESYYTSPQIQGTAAKAFPSQLQHLLVDPRFLEKTHHLRRLYPDPMTGKEWDLIRGPGGQIIGVKSSSNKVPFKQDGFSEINHKFRGQQSYANWQFVYQPPKNTHPPRVSHLIK
jgi:type II secretory pathway pseudopilin PulG